GGRRSPTERRIRSSTQPPARRSSTAASRRSARISRRSAPLPRLLRPPPPRPLPHRRGAPRRFRNPHPNPATLFHPPAASRPPPADQERSRSSTAQGVTALTLTSLSRTLRALRRLRGDLRSVFAVLGSADDDAGGGAVPRDLLLRPPHPLAVWLPPVRDGVPLLQVQSEPAHAARAVRAAAARHHPAPRLQRDVRRGAPDRIGVPDRLSARSARDPGAGRFDRRDARHRPGGGRTGAAGRPRHLLPAPRAPRRLQ